MLRPPAHNFFGVEGTESGLGEPDSLAPFVVRLQVATGVEAFVDETQKLYTLYKAYIHNESTE